VCTTNIHNKILSDESKLFTGVYVMSFTQLLMAMLIVLIIIVGVSYILAVYTLRKQKEAEQIKSRKKIYKGIQSEEKDYKDEEISR